MNWFLPRLMAGLIAVLVGAGLGYMVAGPANAPMISVLLGTAAGVTTVIVLDTLRGTRLMKWLRGSMEGQAPRDAGFWGEVGYRVERAVRLREGQIEHEKTRLAQFLSAIDVSPNGVLMLDANDQIDWCNSMAADHFGLDPQRDRRQRITNLVRAPAFVTHLQSRRFDDAVTFPSPRGVGTVSVMVRAYGEGAKLVLSQDVTQRERSDAMRRDFVANVSHEIRTPLTVLSGFIETLANLPLTEVERSRVLSLMSQQTQRMQALVADLLTLAQIEGSPRPPADRWVSVSKVMGQIDADARTLSRGRHEVTLVTDDAAQVAGSEGEIFSALANLANNAVRYTPEGGRIDITWRLLSDGAGEFSVKDNGVGIEKEHLPRLTERFYRVDGSRSRDTGGTGLGLSIVKHVVQRHGGELDIISEPGKGSLFRLVFPPARVRYIEPARDPRSERPSLESSPADAR